MRSRSVCLKPIHGSAFGRRTMPALSVAFVNVDQRECQVGDQSPEGDGQGLPAPDENVIMVAAQGKIRGGANGLTQPSPDSVALRRSSDFARDGEPDPGSLGVGRWLLPAARLQAESLRMEPPAARRGEKVFALLQPARDNPTHSGLRGRMGIRRSCVHGEAAERRLRSGGKTLAAAGPTGRDHPAAADGRHARAKAVTTLPNELAGLISPLHDELLKILSSAEGA